MNSNKVVKLQLASYANKRGYWFDFPDHREFYPEKEPVRVLRRILELMDKGFLMALEPNPHFAATSLMDDMLAETQSVLRTALRAIDSFLPAPPLSQEDDDIVDIMVDGIDYIANRPEEFSSELSRADIEQVCNPCATRDHIVAAIKEELEENPNHFAGMSQQNRAWFVWTAYRDYENSCS